MATKEANSVMLTEAFNKTEDEIIGPLRQCGSRKFIRTKRSGDTRETSDQLALKERTARGPHKMKTRAKRVGSFSGQYSERPFRFELSNVPIDATSKRKAQLVRPENYPRSNALKKERVPSPRLSSEEGKKPSLEFDQANKKPEVCAENITVKKKRGRPPKVDKNIVINEILSRRAQIITAKQHYVAKVDPVWTQIANALGNVINPRTVYAIAQRKDVRSIMFDKKIKVPVNVHETRSARRIAEEREAREQINASEKKDIASALAKHNRSRGKDEKVDLQVVVDAIAKRRSEVVTPEGRYALTKHPVWSRIASDLENAIAPETVRAIACRENVCALVSRGAEVPNILRARAEENGADAAGTDTIRYEINEMVFEDAINKLLKIVDSRDCLIGEITKLRKESREDIQKLGKNIEANFQALRNDLRERDNNFFATKKKPTIFN